MSFLRKTVFVAFLLASAFSANSVQAVVVNVEPDFFAAGTDISNNYPFVTLSVSPASSSVYSVLGDSTFLGANIARTGTHVFGWASPVVTDPQWGNTGPDQRLLRADFSAPVNFVTIDMIFDDDDTGALRGYNSVGDLLVEYIVSGDGREFPGFATAAIFRPQGDIAYCLHNGWLTVFERCAFSG
jgi:hypothetical protein